MVRFEGDREFPLPAGEAHARLTDVPFLTGCIPDVEAVRSADADRAELVLRPGFSFARGTLDVVLSLTERAAPGARFLLTSKGIGSSSEVEAAIVVSDAEGGCRVHWT